MAERLRILHMLPDLQVGGGQELLLRNATALQGRDIQSFICSARPRGTMERRFTEAGLPVYHLGLRSARDLPAAIARVVRLTRRLGVDLIHTNNTGPDKLLGHLAALQCGVPTVNSVHSEYEPPPPPRGPVRAAACHARARTTRLLDRLAIWHVIAVSTRALESWSPYLQCIGVPAASRTVVHAGLDLGRYTPHVDAAALRASVGLPADAGPILMNVARLVPGKGQRWLIPVMKRVVAEHPNARLVLIGEGEDRPTLEGLIHGAGLQGSVHLLGARSDVPELLQLADLFIFPSMSEGFGLAPLEAMAAGKPVLAFRLPSLEEFIDESPGGGSGVMVERGSEEALGTAALELLSRPDRLRAMGAAGQRIVAARFSLDRAAADLQRVYLSVLGRESPASAHAQATSNSGESSIDASCAATSSR